MEYNGDMDSVTVDGKAYIRAAKAADEVGYTGDYVGQLCRKGALDAMLLGKTWYVREGELYAHKQSLPRKNVATTKRDVEKQKSALNAGDNVLGHDPISVHPRYRADLLGADIRYTQETEDLLPRIAPEPIQHVEVPIVSDMSHYEAESGLSDHAEEEVTYRADDLQEPKYKEISVPIRKITPVAGSISRPTNEVPTDETVKEGIYTGNVVEPREKSENSPVVAPWQVPARRRQVLPAFSALVVLGFALASILFESTWHVTNDGSSQTHFETSYGVASLNTIIETFRTN